MKPRFRGSSTVAVVLLVAAIELVGTHFAALRQPAARPVDALAYVLLLAGPALLLLRRRLPGPMAAGVATVAGSYILLGYAWGPFSLSLILGLVFAVLAQARWWAWGAIAGLGLLLGAAAVSTGADTDLVRLGAGLAWLTVVVLVAELLRIRAERRAERRRVLLTEQQRARDEERLMLARDIHDVVAHSLSMINVQASVALHLADKDPEQLRPALEIIKAASRDALVEVREVLNVLRQDAPRGPVQRLAQLPELVGRAARTGLQVSLARPLPAGLDAQLETAAYRAVQEALTNVVRHAHASRVWVAVTVDAGELVVRVADDGVGPGGAGRTEGNGLRGMRERIEALGGQLMVTDRAAGGRTGTEVLARIPLPAVTGNTARPAAPEQGRLP